MGYCFATSILKRKGKWNGRKKLRLKGAHKGSKWKVSKSGTFPGSNEGIGEALNRPVRKILRTRPWGTYIYSETCYIYYCVQTLHHCTGTAVTLKLFNSSTVRHSDSVFGTMAMCSNVIIASWLMMHWIINCIHLQIHKIVIGTFRFCWYSSPDL